MRWPPDPQALLEYALDQRDASARCDRLLEPMLLGAVLCSDRIEAVWHLLVPGDFFDVVHGVIWAACLRLRAEHHVRDDYVRAAVVSTPGAAARVDELVRSHIPSDAEVPVLLVCASRIRLAALQRRLARAKAA